MPIEVEDIVPIVEETVDELMKLPLSKMSMSKLSSIKLILSSKSMRPRNEDLEDLLVPKTSQSSPIRLHRRHNSPRLQSSKPRRNQR